MDATLRETLRADHRALDELFGRFLAAATHGDAPAATGAIAAFDDALRRHTKLEDEQLLPPSPDGSLATRQGETPGESLFRELRLEHVQVRELSAMIRRLLEEKTDLSGALRLAGNLARRWDAHTGREERELFGGA
ncbi:MAG: hemerythrin domain-containing protein [Syntrophomonadaceae bacterium]